MRQHTIEKHISKVYKSENDPKEDPFDENTTSNCEDILTILWITVAGFTIFIVLLIVLLILSRFKNAIRTRHVRRTRSGQSERTGKGASQIEEGISLERTLGSYTTRVKRAVQTESQVL